MVCGAVTASAQDEDEIVHARVLMDTTLTLGTYDEATAFTVANHWGYIDPADTDFAAGTAGSLGDADFLWRGVEYTVVALAVEGTSSVVIAIEDGAGADLPATASIGVELTRRGGDAYLLPWPQYSTNDSELTSRSEALLGDWRTTAAGTRLAVRILDLDAPDLWKADFEFAAELTYVSNYGYGNKPGLRDDGTNDGPGTLQPTTFEFDGVAYTVDRLILRTPATADNSELWFRTTPHLARHAGYRLALPLTDSGRGIVYQFALDAGDFSQEGEPQPGDGDYVWDVDTHTVADGPNSQHYGTATRKVYLTRSPGDTESARPFWSATLTPANDQEGTGYYDVPGDAALNEIGTLTDTKATLGSVSYTVNAIVFITRIGDYRDLVLATTPPLPEGLGIGVEVAYRDRTAVYWVDTADTMATDLQVSGAYVWDDIPADHGWENGGARSVSLLAPRALLNVVHPRVLLDAVLTVGIYAEDFDPGQFVWGFVDAGVDGLHRRGRRATSRTRRSCTGGSSTGSGCSASTVPPQPSPKC